MIPQQSQNIPPHLNCQSLRRSRSRPSPSSSVAIGGGHYQTPGVSKSMLQENPYQQPYLGTLGRSAGLSDSPTSDNASDATLTDSELPISNQNALPLQNGGLLMGDFSTASGKLNSLKRNINSNGKSTTGIGHHSNHDNLIDHNQFVMHTSGGKIYIPQETPKNSTSDYKTSPSSSPTKKISGLLYKDAVNMGTLRDGRSMSKSDDDDFMYKVKRFCCTCNKSLAIVLIFLLCVSFIVNILLVFGIGALPWEDSAKCCVQGVTGTTDDSNRDLRQSSTSNNASHSRRPDKSTSSSGDGIVVIVEAEIRGEKRSRLLHDVAVGSSRRRWRRESRRLKRNVLVEEDNGGRLGEKVDLHLHAAQDGVNEMVTTSTKPITEGIEEVEEYPPSQNPNPSHHTFSLEEQNVKDSHKISESVPTNSLPKNQQSKQVHPVPPKEDSGREDGDIGSQVKSTGTTQSELSTWTSILEQDESKTSGGEGGGEEIADDSTRRNIFDHLIEVVSQKRGKGLVQNTTSPSSWIEPVMNVEETTRKTGMRMTKMETETENTFTLISSNPHIFQSSSTTSNSRDEWVMGEEEEGGGMMQVGWNHNEKNQTVPQLEVKSITNMAPSSKTPSNLPPMPVNPYQTDPTLSISTTPSDTKFSHPVHERLVTILQTGSTSAHEMSPDVTSSSFTFQNKDSFTPFPPILQDQPIPHYSYDHLRDHDEKKKSKILTLLGLTNDNKNNKTNSFSSVNKIKSKNGVNYQHSLSSSVNEPMYKVELYDGQENSLERKEETRDENSHFVHSRLSYHHSNPHLGWKDGTPMEILSIEKVDDQIREVEEIERKGGGGGGGGGENSEKKSLFPSHDLQLLANGEYEENNVIKGEEERRNGNGFDGTNHLLDNHHYPTTTNNDDSRRRKPLPIENNQIDDDGVHFLHHSPNENQKSFHYPSPVQPRDPIHGRSDGDGKFNDERLGGKIFSSTPSPQRQHQSQYGNTWQNEKDADPPVSISSPLNNNNTNILLVRKNITNNILTMSSSSLSSTSSSSTQLSLLSSRPTTIIEIKGNQWTSPLTKQTMTTTSLPESESNFGGVCQCFCPCLANLADDSSSNEDEYEDNDKNGGINLGTTESIVNDNLSTRQLPNISSLNSHDSGDDDNPEDEEFIVVTTNDKNIEEKLKHVKEEDGIEFSGSGSGSGSSSDSGFSLELDQSFSSWSTESDSNSVYMREDQYLSSSSSSPSPPLTVETITMQYDSQDNNRVSQEILSPRLEKEGTENPIVSYPFSVLNTVDEFTLSSRDSPLYNLSNGKEGESGGGGEEDFLYDDDDDNETVRPIVQVSTMDEMGSTRREDYNNHENSLAGNTNGIPKEGQPPQKELGEGDETFQWIQCTCTSQLAKNYDQNKLNQEQVEPGIRTFPAVNFPPDGTSFAQITMGSRLSNIIGSYSYWNMQFYQSEGAYVTWEMSVPRGSSMGFYARRNALPTHTHYDFMEILRGFKARSKRSSPPSVTKEVSKFIEQGHWFLSIYNDDSDPQEVIFALNISEEMTEGCPNGCSGNGQCQAGHCVCQAGFGSEDCSQSICPVLCSGRGEYSNGECECNPGWKGKICQLRHDECEVSDCNGHGKCVNGKCACFPKWTGENCEETDCAHPTCSGHGFCMGGTCMCKKGWRGADCSHPDNEALQCLPDCSSHGVFNLETQTCVCEKKYMGEDCSKELCDTNCGAHGICIGGGCQCSEGWTGPLCNQRVCDDRCIHHGQCKNGTCLCVTGWNGRHCTLEGCPNACSGHGQCKANYEGFWECKCHTGWTGLECSVMMEQNCNDGKDNDKDGLTDCEDPECCSVSQCEKSQLCVSARKPIDILLRKQPPAITASFFEKMKFLIEEGSLQSYARQDAFNGSRSGVVRGRVVTPNFSGLMGVRVSSTSPLEPLGGFTLTQDDGWFDLMVNGGGAVTLHFGRSPFNPQTRTIFVPWNEVVIIDTVVMGSTDAEEKVFIRGQSCDSHDYDTMKPIVLATWKHGFQGDCPETSTILVESQVVQESIRIPGTGLHLMYHSSRVQGYLSTIQLQLTAEAIPPSLKRVHLRITIEGVLFEKTFEADPDIKFTYAWNRLNVYRQRVYGVTTAIVKVGYEYNNCASIIWDVQSTTLSGHDMSISDIGMAWNLDIHHRYNFHEGIIQKGDGSNIYLKHRPRVIITTMGNGYQRSLDCQECNGVASKQRLLAPVALQASPDGTVFVGDFDLIRRVMVDGTVHTIVKLNATRVSYRYHMALSPVDNFLYISDPESHQIIRVRNIEDTTDPEHNWEPVVGSGERCLPGDEAHCGDDALARDAKLAYPKGVAVSSDNVLYFADGTNIRKVDRDGIITTVIGNHQQKSHWKPIPCEGTLKVEEVHLRWPTELAVNPLDNSLYIIDDHMILKLTEDNRIRIIAGRPFHCTIPLAGYDMDLATNKALISPQSMTFASNGDLYVAESDSQRINRVRLVTTDGRISHFAGAESKCNCLDQGCSCFEDDYFLAATSKFNTISAICMTPDGVLHIADQGNNRIRSIMASIPQSLPTESRQYEIYSTETQEIYVFNRFGQHVATKNIVTGETIYTFLYNVNMSNGKLSSVTDSTGNKIQILRDYSSQVKTIENSQAQKFNLKMSRVRMLQEFSTPEGYNLTFDYHGSTGLIKSRQDSSGRSSVYSYDEFGRLTMAVSPTGQVVTLTFDLSQKGASVKVTRDENFPEVVLIKGSTIYKRKGKTEEVTTVQPDGSVIRSFPWAQTITTETVPYNILGDISPILSDSFPIPGKQRTELAGDLVNRVEWRYVGRKEGRGKNKQLVQVDKKMRINGENILVIEYDRETKSEIVFTDDRNQILNVSFDRSSRPSKWTPSRGFAPVELEYDRFGRLIGWKWDDLTEIYEYDRSGRLFKIDYTDGTSLTHTFRDLIDNLPLKMTTGGGSDYLIEYDTSGAFQSLTTPRGHIHNFGISTSIGAYEYVYKAPSSRDVYKIQYNDLGQIMAIIYPQGAGRINYVYNKYNKLEATVAGLRSARFSYQENTGLLKVADVFQSSFEVKVEYKYHGGVIKEQREKYGSTTGLDNVHLKYQYDGNARLNNVEAEVNGKNIQGLSIRKSQNTGMLETVQDLTIYQTTSGDNFNRTLVQDASKTFQKIVERDRVGRMRRSSINLKGVEVFKLHIDYDTRGKVKHRKMTIAKSAYADNVDYDADGHVGEVMGSGNWKYVYDENGNIIQIMEQGEKSSLIYDSGDRVIQVGELFRYTYDPRGFLVQRGNEKFQYDDKGLLLHTVKKDVYKVWFFYDHQDRLVSWKDDQGNVTQFLYANPETPHLITHVHFPFWGKNYLLLYDNTDALVGLISSDSQRYYVATDQNKSPLAVFNSQGNVVKEIHRTPFGKVVRDTNPEFYLPLDFHGGVVDRQTGIVVINGRPYDPSIGQWMVPKWETLSATLKAPTDIFSYRFAKNDPITPRNIFVDSKMTSLKDWLTLYGYDVNKIFGQDYISPITVEPTVTNNPHLVPEFRAVAGLDCIAKTVTNGFKTIGFRRGSKLKTERLLSGSNEWDLMNKIAYKSRPFGPGLLISRVDGKALVSTVDNSVVQGVITSVLNGSLFIDFKSTHGNTFYFVKDNPHKLRDDREELKRLGGLYNISVHDEELRLSTGDTSVAVRYGTDGEEEFGRLIKHAHRRAIEKAWEEEKNYISKGLEGRRSWTDEEKDLLISKGNVHGYKATDLYSVHKFPQLADDPNNVVFTKDARRKRRKSSKRHHEHEHSSSSLIHNSDPSSSEQSSSTPS